MNILLNNLITIPVLSEQDKERLKNVALHSVCWVASAVALHILLPVPGKGVCAAAGTILLTGLLFTRCSSGDYGKVIPHEFPWLPHLSLLFATMVLPYSHSLGLALSVAAGSLHGFYISRLKMVPVHEMVGF